jgi:hypothetical protein
VIFKLHSYKRASHFYFKEKNNIDLNKRVSSIYNFFL